MTRPKFSILIPTRDRPELLAFALQSAKLQTFGDFELIVSDNFVEKSARAVFDEHADSRFRYVRPPEPVSMADNWEFASLQARGEYLTVLIDKTVLLPSTLSAVDALLAQHPAEIVSWWEEGFHLDRELDGDFRHGLYGSKFAGRVMPAFDFDASAELARRFRFDVRRGSEGVRYGYGKICFGAYAAALVDRVRERCGRVFWPLCPDYTSMTLALAFARGSLDLGRAGLMSVHTTTVSNGARFVQNASHARWFSNTSGEAYAPENWPVPGVYASSHNLVAFDYAHMKRLAGDALPFDFDMPNLLLRVREDLDEVGAWPSADVKAEQYSRWEAALARLPAGARDSAERAIAERVARNGSAGMQLARAWAAGKALIKRVPGATGAWRALLGERAPSRAFETVIDAATFADRQLHIAAPHAARGH